MRNFAFILTRTLNMIINGNYASAFVYMMRKFSVVITFQNPPPVIIDLKFFLA